MLYVSDGLIMNLNYESKRSNYNLKTGECHCQKN